MQGLKEVTMHEVGHTLGLRHNFKSSTLLTLDEMNDPDKVRDTGLTASVMDYAPVNIVPQGMKQGDFYSTTIGPYDNWAIEYGYRPLSSNTQNDQAELQKIAARSGEASLSYATDEDTRGIDPDPFTNRFDLGKDPLEFAHRQSQLTASLMPTVVDRMTKEGDDYSQARQAFNVLLANYGRAMHFASRFIGGLDVSRSHKGDKDAAAPFRILEPAKQREALQLLKDHVFSDKPYEVDPQLYNLLAPSRWNHWGMPDTVRTDFPVHEVILMWQSRILQQLLSSLTLERLHDAELKTAADREAFTAAELIEELTNIIFSELNTLQPGEYTTRKPAISSLRRNLQREYLTMLSSLALGQTAAPPDCQAVAYAQLVRLADTLAAKRAAVTGLDSYTLAHLQTSEGRIRKVLDASLQLPRP